MNSSSDLNEKQILEKLMTQAKGIELMIYQDATTYEEYIDPSTFSKRFLNVIRRIKDSKQSNVDNAILDLSNRFDLTGITV